MKFTNTRAFEKHLIDAAPRHFAPVYLLIGKDDFERKEAENILLNILLKDIGSREHALQVFDADRASIEEILAELSSMSFFAKQRIICVHNAEKLNKEATNKVEDYFESPSSSVFFVLSASAINRGTKFYKKSEKVGIILDLQEEKAWEKESTLANKVTAWALQSNKKIDLQTARFFVQHSGTDQTVLYNEMEKLLCYVAEKSSITTQDIMTICTGVNTKNAWQLGDAIFRRDGASALKVATSLLHEGSPFFSLVRQLRSQFQTKLIISTILLEGGGPEEVLQKYPYMKGQILQQNLQLARSYGMEALKKGILAIDESELLAKNSSIEEELLTQRLIIKLIG